MQQNLLTVIIPTFNDSQNIYRCLQSVFNQSFKDIEVIVINDASTDYTLEILETYRHNHHIKIINMPQNMGAGACRNRGILEASSEYITFIDSDDWIDIGTYEKCFEQFKYNPDVIIYGLIYDYVEYNYRIKKYIYNNNYKINGEYALNIYSHTISTEINISPIVNNKIYKKEFFITNNLLFDENLRYQEDDVFTFEVFVKSHNVIFIKDCFYHYNQRCNSLIHNVSSLSIEGFVNAYKSLKNNLESQNLFNKYKTAFYLKFKSSLLGVIKRTIDYSDNQLERNKLLVLLFELISKNFDFKELLSFFDLNYIRSFL